MKLESYPKNKVALICSKREMALLFESIGYAEDGMREASKGVWKDLKYFHTAFFSAVYKFQKLKDSIKCQKTRKAC